MLPSSAVCGHRTTFVQSYAGLVLPLVSDDYLRESRYGRPTHSGHAARIRDQCAGRSRGRPHGGLGLRMCEANRGASSDHAADAAAEPERASTADPEADVEVAALAPTLPVAALKPARSTPDTP
jgi:hypothetical protein